MSSPTAGAFGKIPGAGDFLRLSAPAGFVDPWDDWLQGTMLAAAEVFGPEWENRYMSAPIWRFTLAPGLAGPAPITGVLMPSVDRVGRRFPLTLMTPLSAGKTDLGLHFARDDFFTALEDAALAALEDGFDRTALEDSLGTIAPPPQAARADARVVPLAEGTLMSQEEEEGSTGHALTGWLLSRQFPLASLWTTTFNGRSYTTVSAGLPVGRTACALFDPEAMDHHQGTA